MMTSRANARGVVATAILGFVSALAGGLTPVSASATPPPQAVDRAVDSDSDAGVQPATNALATDVDSLRDWIHRIHPAPYRFHSAFEFDSAAADLRRRIDGLPEHHVPIELHGILALLGDGHSELAALPPSLRGPGLPLFIRRFAEGWFVTTGHTDLAALFGRPIVSIGGVPMPELVRRLTPYLPADNPMDRLDAIGNWIRNARVLQFADIAASAGDEVVFEIVEPDGSHRNVPVEVRPAVRLGPDWTDIEKYLNPEVPEPLFRTLDGNYACRYLPRERAVYLVFNEVRDGEDLPPIGEFFPEALAFAERTPAERLVLDIRENGGGNLDLNAPVIRSIIRSRFDHPGRLYVIIGDDTFSAAMHLAVTLERLAHPIFVGVPTAGRPNSPGDTRELTLPASGVEIEISELFWQQSDPRDERPWITPDIPITPTMRDRLDGRDAALEAALRHESTADERAAFRPTMSRWTRSSQATAPEWPELLEPAARPIDPEARPMGPDGGIGPAEMCEDETSRG
ncbi:MAG: hypothetical protein ACODAA_05965 [Gemmatimonadota bacterium]